jgi:glycosyltransferase involved in cell wall biosynthesis
MNIWLVRISEPLPVIDGENVRLLRAGLLADYLSNNQHNVLWWTSDHNHPKSKLRFGKDTDYKLKENFRIKLLTGACYTKRVSFKRFYNHYQVAQKFKNLAPAELKISRPDVVVVSLPVIDIAWEVVNFCKKNNIPVVVDLRDMWPEVFVNRIFPNSKKIGRLLFSRQFRKMHEICTNSSALWGISDGFLKWGLSYASRDQSVHDKYFYLSNKKMKLMEDELLNAKKYWSDLGVVKNNNKITLVYVGNFSSQVAFDKLIPLFNNLDTDYQLIIAGSGDTFPLWKKLAENNTRIIFPGWIDHTKISTLYTIADFGMVPYYSTDDFKISIPNKAIEYISYKLPILTTLMGTLENFILDNKCGKYIDLDSSNLFEELKLITSNKDIIRNDEHFNTVYDMYFNDSLTYGRMEESLIDLIKEQDA